MDRETRIVSLSMEEWCELAKKGIAVPVTTRLHGKSMEPTIRYMKDPVTIIPVDRELVPGDVVLFERADGVHVVHRLYWISDDKQTVQTWGDNCYNPDKPVAASSVLGIVASFRRDGKLISLLTEKQRIRGINWMNSRMKRFLWFFYRRLRSLMGKIIRKVQQDFWR